MLATLVGAAPADLAGRNQDLSRKSFKVGNAGITTMLDAERLIRSAQLTLDQARAQQLIDVARLGPRGRGDGLAMSTCQTARCWRTIGR